MTPVTRHPRSARRPLQRLLAPLLLVLGLVVAACATQNQVAQIVASSNAAMLAGRFDLAVAPTAGPDGKDAVQQEYDRIEAFLATHADPQYLDLTTPLRLRRAVLLLNDRQLNLAKAAFAEVDRGHLHTTRDRELQELRGARQQTDAPAADPPAPAAAAEVDAVADQVLLVRDVVQDRLVEVGDQRDLRLRILAAHHGLHPGLLQRRLEGNRSTRERLLAGGLVLGTLEHPQRGEQFVGGVRIDGLAELRLRRAERHRRAAGGRTARRRRRRRRRQDASPQQDADGTGQQWLRHGVSRAGPPAAHMRNTGAW